MSHRALSTVAPPIAGVPLATIRHWPVLMGIAALAIPTLFSLARQHWSTEGGAHGPIILATGSWLFWRQRKEIVAKADPKFFGPAAFVCAPLLFLYMFGRIFNVLSIETGALYALLVCLAFIYLSPSSIRRLAFPIIYLAFLISPPGSLITEMTQPLRIWISGLAADTLYQFGYPVGQSGAIIQIAQYELMVEQACAGLNSILSLLALGLFYTHLSPDKSMANIVPLLVSIIPIAIFANILRVLFLILLTFHFGDGVAQGFSHDVAGLTTFVLAMSGLLAVEVITGRLRRRPGRTSR